MLYDRFVFAVTITVLAQVLSFLLFLRLRMTWQKTAYTLNYAVPMLTFAVIHVVFLVIAKTNPFDTGLGSLLAIVARRTLIEGIVINLAITGLIHYAITMNKRHDSVASLEGTNTREEDTSETTIVLRYSRSSFYSLCLTLIVASSVAAVLGYRELSGFLCERHTKQNAMSANEILYFSNQYFKSNKRVAKSLSDIHKQFPVFKLGYDEAMAWPAGRFDYCQLRNDLYLLVSKGEAAFTMVDVVDYGKKEQNRTYPQDCYWGGYWTTVNVDN